MAESRDGDEEAREAPTLDEGTPERRQRRQSPQSVEQRASVRPLPVDHGDEDEEVLVARVSVPRKSPHRLPSGGAERMRPPIDDRDEDEEILEARVSVPMKSPHRLPSGGAERMQPPSFSASPAGRSLSQPALHRSAPPPWEEDVESPRRPLWQRVLIWGSAALVLLTISLAVGTYLVVQHYSRDLPDVHKLQNSYAPPQMTRVLARDGTLLANIFTERRTVVPIERIPDHVKNAFLAAEDAGFFLHEGLDYLGLLRAMVVNVRAGEVKQGGSTITQQVVKNVLLGNERSYRRKIRETILAYRLEQTLTKEQILGMYMNHIYLGHGRYGVEEAGRYLFGKHVEELSVADAALLAGIVAAPERYSPRKSQEKALVRRRFVLDQMLKKGFMVAAVHDAALEESIRLSPAVETESDIAPEMLGHARRLLDQISGPESRSGGYTVYTTIDPELQVQARAALRRGLDDYLKRQKLAPPYTLKERRLWGKPFVGTPKRHGIYVGTVVERDDKLGKIIVAVGDSRGVVDLKQEERFNPTHLSPTDFVGEGAALRVRVVDDPPAVVADELPHLRLELGPQAALVALDPQTREVLAAVGSYEALAGGLDRSIQTKRQPGSTFKPIIYSYALNAHQVTAATAFEFPLEKKAPSSPDAMPPSGAEEAPPTVEVLSLRDGIASSDNRVAAQVFRQVGGVQAVGWAQAMGITSHLGPDESLMLGSYETTVTEMAAAFSVFASGGTALDPLFVSKVENGSGILPTPERAGPRRVMEPDVAYLMTSLLSSVMERGTGKRASTLGRPLAGKTGTTNQAKDAWFVGYSTELVVAVWVGFDDALPLGWGEAGATSALPIWIDFMQASHKGKPVTEFPRHPGLVELLIDPASGLLARYGQEDAVSELFLKGSEPVEIAPEPKVAEEPLGSEVEDLEPEKEPNPPDENTSPAPPAPDGASSDDEAEGDVDVDPPPLF